MVAKWNVTLCKNIYNLTTVLFLTTDMQFLGMLNDNKLIMIISLIKTCDDWYVMSDKLSVLCVF